MTIIKSGKGKELPKPTWNEVLIGDIWDNWTLYKMDYHRLMQGHIQEYIQSKRYSDNTFNDNYIKFYIRGSDD